MNNKPPKWYLAKVTNIIPQRERLDTRSPDEIPAALYISGLSERQAKELENKQVWITVKDEEL